MSDTPQSTSPAGLVPAHAAQAAGLTVAEHELPSLLRTCIHCGLCLSSCPTYLATGDEAESPRGRLMLMAAFAGGAPAAPENAGAPGALSETHGLSFSGHSEQGRAPLDRCLGCRNCESVCPSGVRYGELLEHARARLGPPRAGAGRLVAWMVDHVLSHRRRVWLAARAGQWVQRLRLEAALPASAQALVRGLPARAPTYPARPALPERGDVALLIGCAQPVFTPEVLPAVARLVEACGFAPCVPRGQGCCGALSMHAGSLESARKFARQMVDALDAAETIVVASAGCSAHMRGYGALLASDPAYAERASAMAGRTADLVEWLGRHAQRLAFTPVHARVTYHPPCHHTHAQGISDAPLKLLEAVPGLAIASLRDAERCCGSAGSYSLAQPQLARQVRDAKIDAIAEAAPQLLLTANPGCELFLQQGVRERGLPIPVEHLAVFLARQLAAG